MATNVSTLVRDWIQFLKLNQIVASKSDPSSGKLVYKRKVTAGDVSRFLSNNTSYPDDVINKVIASVLKKPARSKKQNGDPPTDDEPKELPSAAQPRQLAHTPTKIGHDPNSISDIDYRDIKEAFTEVESPDISEEQIEAIFNKLAATGEPESPISAAKQTSTRRSRQASAGGEDTATELAPEESRTQKEEAIRKIKRVIRDTMTDNQRKALWRALNEV